MGKQYYRLHMSGIHKLIHRTCLFHIISMLLQGHKISCERSWFAADIDNLIYTIVDDLKERLRIDTNPRWIEEDKMRLFLDGVDDL